LPAGSFGTGGIGFLHRYTVLRAGLRPVLGAGGGGIGRSLTREKVACSAVATQRFLVGVRNGGLQLHSFESQMMSTVEHSSELADSSLPTFQGRSMGSNPVGLTRFFGVPLLGVQHMCSTILQQIVQPIR
jgi:hypothetical protein